MTGTRGRVTVVPAQLWPAGVVREDRLVPLRLRLCIRTLVPPEAHFGQPLLFGRCPVALALPQHHHSQLLTYCSSAAIMAALIRCQPRPWPPQAALPDLASWPDALGDPLSTTR